jgi:hypothetical protein
MKYFCAWLATCIGVRVFTDHREMFLQSPRPYFSSPSRNSLRHMDGENVKKIVPGRSWSWRGGGWPTELVLRRKKPPI